MRPFRGFDDQMTVVPVPEQFFRDLLPTVEDRAELMVTLYALWLHHAGGQDRPFFREDDLAADERFFQALGNCERTPAEALQEGLERAVARGTLLRVQARVTPNAGEETWYCLNTAANRKRVQNLTAGERTHLGPWAAQAADLHLQVTRPNIFTLYEQNIGLLQPLIAEELRQAEKDYPPDWIEDAFRIAAEKNVRHWKYVRAILERWAREGREDEKDRRHRQEDSGRPLSGRYRDLVQR